MINIDQVRTLELKVKQAVQLITNLKTENNFLRGKLANYEVRIQELENLLITFKDSQHEIEEGIVHALEQLHDIEQSPSQESVTTEMELPKESETPGLSLDEETREETSQSIEQEIEAGPTSSGEEEDFYSEPEETASDESPSFDFAPASEEPQSENSSSDDDQQQGLGIF